MFTAYIIRREEMIEHKLLKDEKILIVPPTGTLEKGDFEKLSAIVDPYLEKEGKRLKMATKSSSIKIITQSDTTINRSHTKPAFSVLYCTVCFF
jgi:hypothetical protein